MHAEVPSQQMPLHIYIAISDDVVPVPEISESWATVLESIKITRQDINVTNFLFFIQHLIEPHCKGRNTEGS